MGLLVYNIVYNNPLLKQQLIVYMNYIKEDRIRYLKCLIKELIKLLLLLISITTVAWIFSVIWNLEQ